MTRIALLVSVSILSACASGPSITTVQEVSATADAPYRKILVVSLFKSFDARRYLETEIVRELEILGVDAVRSTSLMDTRTPVTRQTFVDMVDALGSDAVLVTHFVSLDSQASMKDFAPEATYNIRPTYYYDVWSVELKEYVEPQSLELEHSLVLATQLYSVKNQEPIWGIESRSNIVQDFNVGQDYSVVSDEAKAITDQMAEAQLVVQ